MKTLFGYVGRLGSGKGYCMMQEVERLKTTGNTVYLISFADPIKHILLESFGLTKEGIVKSIPIPTEFESQMAVCRSLVKYLVDIDYGSYSEIELAKLVGDNYEKNGGDQFYQHLVNAMNNVDYALSYRRLAQLLGTELGRYVHDSIWIDIALAKVLEVFEQDLADYAFIDDCRFVNEFNALEQFKKETGYETHVIGIFAKDETRAKRRNFTLDELNEQDSHGSEREIDQILSMIPSENIIIND